MSFNGPGKGKRDTCVIGSESCKIDDDDENQSMKSKSCMLAASKAIIFHAKPTKH